MKKSVLKQWLPGVLLCLLLAGGVYGETFYVDSQRGDDGNPGSKERPLGTLSRAAELVNGNHQAGPTVIKILPGVYKLDAAVVFDNNRAYTQKDRLIIEASVFPGTSAWDPKMMPIVLDQQEPNAVMGTYGIKVHVSHVTIRGLKFQGSATSGTMYAAIERIGAGLKDLLITQCMFLADRDTRDMNAPVIATGDGLVVDHCIFHNCNASAIFWDGMKKCGSKGNAMRYSIVDGGAISGVWTCQTQPDLEFHHNVVTDTEFFWMRKKIEKPIRYTIQNCLVDVKHYSSYGVESGPTGLTGDAVNFDEQHVTKDAKVKLVRDPRAHDYLHVAPGTPGSELSAGILGTKRTTRARSR